jgi:hypothetical protein
VNQKESVLNLEKIQVEDKKKGDAFWKGFTVDFKEASKSFTLNKEVWAKATTDAIRNKENPAIIVVLGEDSKTRLAVVELSLLEMILDQLPPGSV